jgi:hypothetical protein
MYSIEVMVVAWINYVAQSQPRYCSLAFHSANLPCTFKILLLPQSRIPSSSTSEATTIPTLTSPTL